MCSVIESSKDYVTKALVSTVDHLGSVADKLDKLLDKKANELSATNIRFSCIHQVLLLNSSVPLFVFNLMFHPNEFNI